jgi:carbonic anhydrase/acetyltransferase-like protein (isoleucine patch superfamily)
MANVVVFGVEKLAELAHFYLTHDSEHKVVAFTVDPEYLTSGEFKGLPVVPYNELEQHYSPDQFRMFIPMSFEKMNHLRAEKYDDAKRRGYKLISYVSSRATIFPDFQCGDNCFILEDSTIQPFARIGNDVVIWAGSHIGHHAVVEDHVFIARAIISGSCVIEPFSFLGGNSVIRDGVVVARETLVGMETYIARDTKEFEVYGNRGTQPERIRSDRLGRISSRPAVVKNTVPDTREEDSSTREE